LTRPPLVNENFKSSELLLFYFSPLLTVNKILYLETREKYRFSRNLCIVQAGLCCAVLEAGEVNGKEKAMQLNSELSWIHTALPHGNLVRLAIGLLCQAGKIYVYICEVHE